MHRAKRRVWRAIMQSLKLTASSAAAVAAVSFRANLVLGLKQTIKQTIQNYHMGSCAEPHLTAQAMSAAGVASCEPTRCMCTMLLWVG